MKEKIFRAGLIPYIIENGNIQMLFMKPSDSKFGGNQYQVAKGKREEGETNKEAAIREGGEELGFTNLNADGQIMSLGNFLGRTFVFVVKVKSKNLFTETDFETDSTKWMTETDFLKDGRDLHNHIIKSAIRLINKHDNTLKD